MSGQQNYASGSWGIYIPFEATPTHTQIIDGAGRYRHFSPGMTPMRFVPQTVPSCPTACLHPYTTIPPGANCSQLYQLTSNYVAM